MTHNEILVKAIEKAIKRDFTWYGEKISGAVIVNDWIVVQNDVGKPDWMCDYERRPMLIFSKEFAKAFWGVGEEINDMMGNDLWMYDGNRHRDIPRWQYHLQQMVISEDRILYLEKFLD